jgi:hypothetical protein
MPSYLAPSLARQINKLKLDGSYFTGKPRVTHKYSQLLLHILMINFICRGISLHCGSWYQLAESELQIYPGMFHWRSWIR